MMHFAFQRSILKSMHQYYVPFTKEMKAQGYTILCPNMLPMHFKLIKAILKTYGWNMEILESDGPEVAETGLKYVHNDTCYPAILVIGQLMQALQSGKYDPNKVAMIQFQTGGGCRASNYISLLRKALEKAGQSQVPVIAFGIAGLEKHPGFTLTPSIWHALIYAVLYGDLLMTLVNQCRTYEVQTGSARELADRWVEKLAKEMGKGGRISYKQVKRNYRAILESFSAIELEKKAAVRVGIVGEIFVKYSPLGNNRLEEFLVGEGAEVVVPGLIDFCLYCVYNNVLDHELLGRGKKLTYEIYKWVYGFLCKKKHDLSAAILEHGVFTAPTAFDRTVALGKDYIHLGAKMGEGWLLTSEMLELAESGVKNIVCTQPFGCLPNHICGKGMMKPIKERNPDVNIVAIDYDAGATKVNQENRLKLMLANARARQEQELQYQG